MVVFGFAVVGVFCYLDWLTHRELVTTLILGGGAAAAILFRDAIVERAKLGPYLAQIPVSVRPLVSAVPGVVYFMIRGQGTSGAGGTVLIAILLSVGIVVLFGRAIDTKLAGFYAARNRILPLALRMALALVLPILAAFLVIHGSLADLPALFGGTTKHPMSPSGREGPFFLGTVVSSALAFLMLRGTAGPAGASRASSVRPPTQAIPVPSQVAPAVPPAVWSSTHVVPDGGLPAWGSPDAGTASIETLNPGLPVKLLQRLGDWAQIEASNGWTGWVDGRRLVGGRG